MTYELKASEDMAVPARDLFNLIEKRKGEAVVVALKGDLGAGKTTFSKEFAKLIGVKEEIVSPTFVLMKIYDMESKGFKKYIHIDAYRFANEKELSSLGWDDLISDESHLIFIEWPEMVSGLIPDNAIRLSFEHGERENERKLSIEI